MPTITFDYIVLTLTVTGTEHIGNLLDRDRTDITCQD